MKYPGTTDSPGNNVSIGQEEVEMGDKGKKDKGKREIQKKTYLTLKEKRKQKKKKGSVHDIRD